MCANDALLLIGHGSSRYPDAGSPMLRHAQALRAEGRFREVETALLNGNPSVKEALSRISCSLLRVVPFFMEDGYFSRVAIPAAIKSAIAASSPDDRFAMPEDAGDFSTSRRIILCPPIGIHDGMAGLIEHQALAACAEMAIPTRDAAILVAGHGSSTAPGRALALHRHAARVAATELFARVEAACLEEPPFIADTLRGLRAHPVIVIGFFANQGGHVRDDIPALAAAETATRGSNGLKVRFHGCVAEDLTVTQIIMDQAAVDPRRN